MPEDSEADPPIPAFLMPPSPWAAGVARVCDGLTVLVLALIVMEQWMVWFMFTGLLWSPWSIGLGIAVAAAQILMMFSRQEPSVCELPGSKDSPQ